MSYSIPAPLSDGLRRAYPARNRGAASAARRSERVLCRLAHLFPLSRKQLRWVEIRHGGALEDDAAQVKMRIDSQTPAAKALTHQKGCYRKRPSSNSVSSG